MKYSKSTERGLKHRLTVGKLKELLKGCNDWDMFFVSQYDLILTGADYSSDEGVIYFSAIDVLDDTSR